MTMDFTSSRHKKLIIISKTTKGLQEAISVLPSSLLAARVFGITPKMQDIKNHTDGLWTNAVCLYDYSLGKSNVSAVDV